MFHIVARQCCSNDDYNKHAEWCCKASASASLCCLTSTFPTAHLLGCTRDLSCWSFVQHAPPTKAGVQSLHCAGHACTSLQPQLSKRRDRRDCQPYELILQTANEWQPQRSNFDCSSSNAQVQTLQQSAAGAHRGVLFAKHSSGAKSRSWPKQPRSI